MTVEEAATHKKRVDDIIQNRGKSHEHTELEEHMEYRNYMRDLVLGANDGLVSIFALVLGVAGSGFNPQQILFAGIAGSVAGAISMAIGEYLSTKSQEQVYDSEKKLEMRHIDQNLDHEIDELYEFYEEKGFKGEMLDGIVKTIAYDKEILLKEMMMAEFGVLEEERRAPITATLIVGLAFFLGSLPAVVPFAFVNTTLSGIWIGGALALAGLFLVGSIKARFTRMPIGPSGVENMLLGLAGAAITYVIGLLIGGGIA